MTRRIAAESGAHTWTAAESIDQPDVSLSRTGVGRRAVHVLLGLGAEGAAHVR